MVHRIDVENRDGIAVVSILNAPVNALSADVREDLFVALSSLQNDRSVLAVVITGAGRCFSAGADINEFRAAPGAFAAKRDPVEIGRLLDGFSKPVVAAINGPALGGGLELAMSCHWRVASHDAALGLPEISLGLLPGAGGTQRLPRLVGVKNALDMMLTGKKVVGSEAREIGLVDAVTEGSVVDAAVSFIYEAFASRKVPNGASTVVLSGLGDAYRRMIDDARARAMGMKAKRFAAEKIIDCTLSAIQLAFPEGLALERKAFEECLSSQEAGALQHGFFASRAAGRADRDRAVPRGIQVVGVVGAGTMGQGIAMSFATAGLTVRIVDISEERAQRAANAIRAEYQRQVERGRLRQVEAASCIARLSAFSSIDAVSSCDLVVEAVFEDLEVKLDMSAKLGKVCREGAIIASNTSTLDINRLAEASGRPQDFLGLHFFSPANVMRLVEVIRGEKTSPDAIATVVGVVRSMNKVPVVCEVCWGFVGNRMLESYLRETEALLLEGASPSQIDRAVEQFGMAMGPCRMMDLAGVDVVAKVVSERARNGDLPADPDYRIVTRHLAELGRFGQKSGEGFYRYDGRTFVDDIDARSLVQSLARRRGILPRDAIEDAEIVERCILPVINEGFQILYEGVASRASDIDVVWLSGYGFPEKNGGPMYYADRILGRARLMERLQHYAASSGNQWGYWTPTDALTVSRTEIDGETVVAEER